MKQQEKNQEKKQEDEKINLWCEPQMDPNTGQIICKMPPKMVMDLLENPTRENAQKYIEWNNKKMEKIAEAQKVIEKISEQNSQISIKDIQKIEFYFSTSCPHCKKQAFVIKKIAKLLPGKIDGYLITGDSVSLAKFLQETGLKMKIYSFSQAKYENITAVPVTIFYFKNGAKKEFVGYHEKFNILEIDK